MPWTPPASPIANTIITVAWANSSVVNPITWLRSMTGGVDPWAANLALYSTGPSATSWGKLPDEVLLLPKVQRGSPQYASFAAAAAEYSSFCWINSSPGIPDAPIPTQLDWYLMQVRHPNTGINFHWQLTCSLSDPNALYSRTVSGGVAGPWRKVLTESNVDPLVLSGGSRIRDDVPGNMLQIWANGDHLTVFNEAATLALFEIISSQPAPLWKGQTVWHSGNDGAGSTLDAGLFGGQLPAFYATDTELAAHAATTTHVPSGLIAAFGNAGSIAAGWSRFTAGNGRLLVGAGTVAGQTFVEGASAGSSWAHLHAVSLTAAAVSGGNVQSGGSSTANTADHTHPVSGNTADQTWIPPMFTVVWAQKS